MRLREILDKKLRVTQEFYIRDSGNVSEKPKFHIRDGKRNTIILNSGKRGAGVQIPPQIRIREKKKEV